MPSNIFVADLPQIPLGAPSPTVFPRYFIDIGDAVAGPQVMGFITQRIGEKKRFVAEIIEEAYHDRLKAFR
ncbi:hypothetical protein P692DRAFT_20880339 [Suillus brevipes Sb2]|nr:hypothetical protein P692DRAFT_20880339 [Suillus brevipes Sb2]